MQWYEFKRALTEVTGISQDALHIMAGVAIQLAVARLSRRSVASFIPLAVVLAAALVNEWFDLGVEVWPDRDWQWLESVKDLAVTMTLPTVMLVLARCSPRLLVPGSGTDETPEAPADDSSRAGEPGP